MSDTTNFLKGFKDGMAAFGKNISMIVNTIMLIITYIIGVGSAWILSRITGKKFIDIALSRRRQTYWTDLKLKKKQINEYYRQF